MLRLYIWLITALLSALFTATSLVLKRLTFNRHGGFWEVFYFNYIVSGLMLIPLLVISFSYYGLPTVRQLEYSFLYGLLSNTFMTLLFSYSIRECGSVISNSASLSVEPLLAVLLGAVVVGEPVGWNVIVASLIFPLIAYFLYLGGKNGKAFSSCGLKSLIGVFTGASASFLAVFYSWLTVRCLVVNPFLVSFFGMVAGLLVFFPVMWFKRPFSLKVFSGVPKIIYLSVFFTILSRTLRFVSLSYGAPGHTTSIVLLYPAMATI